MESGVLTATVCQAEPSGDVLSRYPPNGLEPQRANLPSPYVRSSRPVDPVSRMLLVQSTPSGEVAYRTPGSPPASVTRNFPCPNVTRTAVQSLVQCAFTQSTPLLDTITPL